MSVGCPLTWGEAENADPDWCHLACALWRDVYEGTASGLDGFGKLKLRDESVELNGCIGASEISYLADPCLR